MVTRKKRIFGILEAEGIPVGDIIALLLRQQGVGLSDVAKKARVHRSFVSKVFAGERNPACIKETVSGVLGFDPWE